MDSPSQLIVGGSPQTATLPDYSPDGGPSCGSGRGAFADLSQRLVLHGGSVHRGVGVPAACASSPTCECLARQAAFDCPRDLWVCDASDAGVAISMGCLAN